MTEPPLEQSARRRAGVPRPQLRQPEIVIDRFRFVGIAVLVVMIAGLSVLGAEVWQLSGRIDQLAVKMDGADTTSGVKFDETNANLDAISQRLSVQLQKMEAEIAAIAKSGAASSSLAMPARVPVQPAPIQPAPRTAGTRARTKTRAGTEGPVVSDRPPQAGARRRRQSSRATIFAAAAAGVGRCGACSPFHPIGYSRPCGGVFGDTRHAAIRPRIGDPGPRGEAHDPSAPKAQTHGLQFSAQIQRHTLRAAGAALCSAWLSGVAVARRIDHRRLRGLFLATDVPLLPSTPGPRR